MSGDLDKNGKKIAKLATEKSNKTAEKPAAQPAPKTAAPAAKPANKSIESPKTPSAAKPTLVAKKVAQFSSHSTSPSFEERHHQENEPLLEAPASASVESLSQKKKLTTN